MYKITITLSLLFISLSGFCDKFVWNAKTGYPGVGRHRSSGIGIGNKVYYGLGHVSSGSVNVGFQDWWEFDPATNAWTQKVNYPIESHGAVGFTIGNKGYMGSGDSEAIGATDLFYEFDPIANTWTSKATCPVNNDGHVSFAINGKGYIGLGAGGTPGLYSYDPITNTWATATTAMPDSWHGSAFVLNNKAYYLPSFSSTLYMFDPVTNNVTTKAPFIGVPRIAAAGFSVRGQGYIGLGTTGFDGPYDLKDIYFYDPITNVWDTIPKSFPGVRRHFVPCVTIGDNVYFGTGTNGTNLADFWAYEWKKDVEISIGINEFEKENSISISPNPTSNYIKINVADNLNKTQLLFKLYTITGKEISSQFVFGNSCTIDVSEFTKGLYVATISSNNKTILTKKVILN